VKRHRLRDLPTALSLLACVALCGLWLRSCLVPERWTRTLSITSSLYVDSGGGQVSVTWQEWWITAGLPPYQWFRQQRRHPLPFRWRTVGFGAEWWRQDQRNGNVRATRSVTAPYWFFAATAAAAPLRRLYRRTRRPAPTDVCANCGYDLRATPGQCPECGTPANVSTTA
jgi:hypothetical protein